MAVADDSAPAIVGVGSVFIDDIVLPDGRTHMGQLGGGTVHALMGAALWGERPGLSAYAGDGLPPAVEARLARHLDLRGLVRLDQPQIRAWQLFEADGKRTEVHRVAQIEPFVSGTRPDDLPDVYRHSAAFYLLQTFDGIRPWLDAAPGLKLWEPNALTMHASQRQAMRDILSRDALAVVSPNLPEAQAVYGLRDAGELIAAMLDDGAAAVALRMGADGSLVATRDAPQPRWVGAVPVTQIADQTGAGNTYCGGLLVGLRRGYDLFEAALLGAVSASFCIETVGVLDPDACPPAERDRRLEHLRAMSG